MTASQRQADIELLAQAEILKGRAKKFPLRILIWGPGDPGPSAPADKVRAYQKRIQVRNVLRDQFTESAVHFSEDPEVVALSSWIVGDQLQRQAFQAAISDCVIALDISRGADLEMDHFIVTYSWFRRKVHVFLPEQYVGSNGLVHDVFNRLQDYQVQGFSQLEFDSCNLATVKAVEAAHTFAVARYLSNIQ